jgi:2'-hydroxyisoflavone reductase
MDILVLGGTRFVGRHLVDAALARGDRVTCFNRGRSGAAPAGVEQRVGDRRADLAALAEGRWDLVVDTCGYLPREVAATAELLKNRVGRYLFVSSVSVYASSARGACEGDPLATIADPDTETVDGRTYGALKALCEAHLHAALGERALVLRPGLIVGPHDPTQRFTWWPARLARAAEDGLPVLAPGRPEAPVQWIDARDLAAFMLHLADEGRNGCFNVVDEPVPMVDFLAACARAAGAQPRWQWLPVADLVALGAEPWSDLPLVVPDDADHAGFMRTQARAARTAGLHTRPMAETITDTLAWWRSLPAEARAFDKAGLAAERERTLRAAAQAGSGSRDKAPQAH